MTEFQKAKERLEKVGFKQIQQFSRPSYSRKLTRTVSMRIHPIETIFASEDKCLHLYVKWSKDTGRILDISFHNRYHSYKTGKDYVGLEAIEQAVSDNPKYAFVLDLLRFKSS